MEQIPSPFDEPLSHEMSDYWCPICFGGGWTMAAYEGPGIIELGEEVIYIAEKIVYLVCPGCGLHFEEEFYEDYL